MPCDSRITQTKMLDAATLAAALRAQGEEIVSETDLIVSTRSGVVFSRRTKTDGFSTNFWDQKAVEEIAQKYGELTARRWAKQRGYVVKEFDQKTKKMVLLKRGT